MKSFLEAVLYIILIVRCLIDLFSILFEILFLKILNHWNVESKYFGECSHLFTLKLQKGILKNAEENQNFFFKFSLIIKDYRKIEILVLFCISFIYSIGTRN